MDWLVAWCDVMWCDVMRCDRDWRRRRLDESLLYRTVGVWAAESSVVRTWHRVASLTAFDCLLTIEWRFCENNRSNLLCYSAWMCAYTYGGIAWMYLHVIYFVWAAVSRWAMDSGHPTETSFVYFFPERHPLDWLTHFKCQYIYWQPAPCTRHTTLHYHNNPRIYADRNI